MSNVTYNVHHSSVYKLLSYDTDISPHLPIIIHPVLHYITEYKPKCCWQIRGNHHFHSFFRSDWLKLIVNYLTDCVLSIFSWWSDYAYDPDHPVSIYVHTPPYCDDMNLTPTTLCSSDVWKHSRVLIEPDRSQIFIVFISISYLYLWSGQWCIVGVFVVNASLLRWGWDIAQRYGDYFMIY